MYDPKDILTEDGYDDYKAHLKNIENGLFYILNNVDDFHIGALDGKQLDKLYEMTGLWEELLPLLKKGDGEKDE